MKVINVHFEDEEHTKLTQAKKESGSKNWREFIIKSCITNEQ